MYSVWYQCARIQTYPPWHKCAATPLLSIDPLTHDITNNMTLQGIIIKTKNAAPAVRSCSRRADFHL